MQPPLGQETAKPGPRGPASLAPGSPVSITPARSPSCQERRVLSLLCSAPAFRERPPSPGSSFMSPFPQSPRKSNSDRLAGWLRRRVVAGRARCGAGPRAAPRGSFLGERAPEPCAAQRPEPGDKHTGGPSNLSALPGTAGDSPGTFGPDSSEAGVQLTSLPPPPSSWCPAGSLRPSSPRCPRPPPPYPLRQKCHSFSAFGSFAKCPRGLQELGCDARRANPADALPRPPAVPCAPACVGEEPLLTVGHRPPSSVQGPLPLPRAFPSQSGCRLPVPRVLIPLLMNILTEANAVEVN